MKAITTSFPSCVHWGFAFSFPERTTQLLPIFHLEGDKESKHLWYYKESKHLWYYKDSKQLDCCIVVHTEYAEAPPFSMRLCFGEAKEGEHEDHQQEDDDSKQERGKGAW